MYQKIVFSNNCIIIFYTIYLLMFSYVKCVTYNRNNYSIIFPGVNNRINRNFNHVKNTEISSTLNKKRFNKLCIINNEFITLKPVQISVNTFWGKESQFNSNFKIDANLNDNFQTVKDLIFKKTGIPTQLQQLYINTNDSNANNSSSKTTNKLIKVDNLDKLNKYINYFKVSKLKEFELDLLLDLPAPVYKTITPEASRLEEYVSGLISYTDLLSKVDTNVLDAKSDKDDVTNKNQSTTSSTDLLFDSNRSAMYRIMNMNKSLEKNKDVKDNKVTSVKRVYIRPFKDFPPDTHLFNERLNSIINYYFPLNIGATIKFSAFCLLFKLNNNYNKLVLDAFTYLPLISILMQTRPGIFLNRLLFHFIANQRIPKLVYNLLPAHLAQKFHSNRTHN